jgi:cytochrome c-type biogenesis protein CcmH
MTGSVDPRFAASAFVRGLPRLAFLLTLVLAAPAAFAVQPDEIMPDPKLEARARDLSSQLRCLVCQNQSIDDSDASLAKDIRVLIRERIAKGESNAEVRDFLVSRYGDFILLKPPFKRETLLLWLSAPLTLALGGAAIAFAARRGRTTTLALSAEEEQRLAEIGGAGEGAGGST